VVEHRFTGGRKSAPEVLEKSLGKGEKTGTSGKWREVGSRTIQAVLDELPSGQEGDRVENK